MTRRQKLEQRLTLALATLARAEKRHIRSFGKWRSARADVVRIDAELTRLSLEPPAEPGPDDSLESIGTPAPADTGHATAAEVFGLAPYRDRPDLEKPDAATLARSLHGGIDPPDVRRTVHFCAGPYCPGYHWPASYMTHPTSCALERQNSPATLAVAAACRRAHGHPVIWEQPLAQNVPADDAPGRDDSDRRRD